MRHFSCLGNSRFPQTNHINWRLFARDVVRSEPVFVPCQTSVQRLRKESRCNGSHLITVTDSNVHAGFPHVSPIIGFAEPCKLGLPLNYNSLILAVFAQMILGGNFQHHKGGEKGVSHIDFLVIFPDVAILVYLKYLLMATLE